MTPDISELFKPDRSTPEAFGTPQCFEAIVRRANGEIHVVIPAFNRDLLWGPCAPERLIVRPGDHVAVALSDRGRPHILAGGFYPPEDWDHGRSDLVNEVRRLAGEIGTLNGQIATLSGQVSATAAQVSSLQGEIARLDGEITRLDQTKEDK